MMEFESRSFNPDVVKSLRTQLGYSAEDVARLTAISLPKYDAIEGGLSTPSAREISKIAKFFRVEEFSLYQVSPPSKNKKINFRAQMRGYKGEPGPILDAIDFASEIQRLLNTVADPANLWKLRNDRRLTLKSEVEFEASWWRDRLDISDESQLDARSHDIFFLILRSRIEEQGISVVVSSYEERQFKGLVIGSRERVPVILINSFKQQKSSRTFTLAHEFSHVLLEDDGVSNPYDASSHIERFCNKFAASLLMPRALIGQLLNQRSQQATSNSTIKWLSNKLKVSMEAVVIRLVECGFANSNFWTEWKAQFAGLLPSEEALGGGGASEEGVDQGLVKLARFGFLFGKVVPDRYRQSGLTAMAVYNASRLKPAYMQDLARATRQRLAEVAGNGGA